MLETSARLLRLLSLLQARRDWPGGDLAERLGVTPRTVRRDVGRLRNLGYPVHATPGVAGGYRLGAGKALPPLLLDDDEAVAVAVGLRTAAGGTVAGIEETSARALAKLEQVLPSRLRRRVNALQSVVPLTGRGPVVDPEALSVIAAACRDHERLRFGYRDRGGSVTKRFAEPHRLVSTGNRWYLMAWDVEREAWRTFRLDRVENVHATGMRFPPHDPPEDAATYVSQALSYGTYRYRARIVLHASLAAAAEKVPPTAGFLEGIDEDCCLLVSGGDSLVRMAVYIAEIGFEFEVLDPPELAGHLAELAGRMGRAARSRR